MLNKESLIEIMQQLKKNDVKELIVTHDRVEMRTYERGGTADTPVVNLAPASSLTQAPVQSPDLKSDAKEETESQAQEKPQGGLVEIKAPLPGTAFLSPGKDNNGNPLPSEGDSVEEGNIIALVEAMKMFNEVFSPVKGTIKSIKVNNEANVKVGDIIMIIEKSA